VRVDISELDKERGEKAWEIYLLHYSRHPREDEHRVPAEIAAWLTRIINQHLIDAARLEGIRLGLEAAALDVLQTGRLLRPSMGETAEAIRLLDPATIAREAVLDKLASEAQEQGMGYEKEADQ
jgi:hypothetical protein